MNWLNVPMRAVAPPMSAACNFAPDQDVWHLSLDQIESGTGEIVSKRYAPASEAGTSTFCFNTGNVLYSKLRPYLNKVIVPNEAGIATTELIPLRPNPEILHPKYLAYYLRASSFVNQASHHVAGAKMPRVVMDWFWEHAISLPSPREQRHIVEFLDEVNRLRRLSRDAKAKAARVVPALFLKMFGDPATNPKGWTPTTVGHLLKATDYGTSTKAFEDGTGLPLVRMGNVDYAGNLDLHELKFVDLPAEEASKFRLDKGDLLFNRTNSIDLVGKTGLWDVDMEAVLASYFIRVRVDSEQAEPEFLWAYMNSAFMKRSLRATARGAIGQANINTTELRSLPLYRPPLELQRDFVMKLKAIRCAMPAGEVSAKLEELYSLFLQSAFSGELTAKWREAHMKELLVEMEMQARQLNLPLPQEATV